MGETGRSSWLDCEAVSNLRIQAIRSTKVSGIGTNCCTAGRQNDAVAAEGPLKPPGATRRCAGNDITNSAAARALSWWANLAGKDAVIPHLGKAAVDARLYVSSASKSRHPHNGFFLKRLCI